MIEIKNLTYTVGGKTILDSVSLTAQSGAVTVLVGNNGSGKTTLLRSVAAYHHNRRYLTGIISVDGVDSSAISPERLASRISLLPQTLPAPKMTVRELVSLGRASLRSPFAKTSREDGDRIDRAIAEMGITRLANSPLPEISGGERQAAYFAMILARNTDCVLLDEPTSALDSSNRALLFSFIDKMRREGRTVLVVLHDLTDATSIADMITVLDKGRVSFSGTSSELRGSDVPRRLFGLAPCMAMTDDGERSVYLPCEAKKHL